MITPPLDPNVLLTAGIALVSAVIGGVISLFGTAYLEARREARDRRNLCAALLAELEGTLHVEESNQYRSVYQACLDTIRSGRAVPMPNIGYGWDGSRSVYYTNLSRIGILPAGLTGKLVRGACIFQVVVVDRMRMDRGDWNTQDQVHRERMLSRHLEVYDELLALCREIIADLRKVR